MSIGNYKFFWQMAIENYKSMLEWCDREIEKNNDPEWWIAKKYFIKAEIRTCERHIEDL